MNRVIHIVSNDFDYVVSLCGCDTKTVPDPDHLGRRAYWKWFHKGHQFDYSKDSEYCVSCLAQWFNGG